MIKSTITTLINYAVFLVVAVAAGDCVHAQAPSTALDPTPMQVQPVVPAKSDRPKPIRTNTLAEAMVNPQAVVRLDLSRKQLTAIPAEVAQMVNLEELIVKGNKIATLPASMQALTKLRLLDLQDNAFASAPDLSGLKGLRRIVLTGNPITQLEASFFTRAVGVEDFQFEKMGLATLPATISQCINMKVLNVNANLLTQLPEEIGMVKQLRKLTIASNKLTSLPAQLQSLPALEELDISGNALVALPQGLVAMAALKSLDASNNSLSTLPSDLSSNSLRTLDLSNNAISTVPQSIKGLQKLEKLSMAKNKLTTLPKEIAECSMLKQLDISGNQLKDLPIAEMANMPSLGTVKFTNVTNGKSSDRTQPIAPKAPEPARTSPKKP
jgi:leucine-rich repeat protein SHOC2